MEKEIFRTPENQAAEPQVETSILNPEPQADTPQRSIYELLASPPQNALKPIVAGNLKGKSDINPQWRIEALTQVFGPCGIGWKFEIVEANQLNLADGQILLYMLINLRYKQGGKWSEPIPGYGGDFIVEKNKNGLVPNDDAYKMCLTDALGSAAKCIGVAADVYRGLYDTKHSRYTEEQQQAKQQPTNQQASYQKQAAPQPVPEQEAWTRFVNGRPQVRGKNGWKDLASLGITELQAVLNSPYYAAVHQAANNLLTTGTL